ncbi:MAG: fluoride ion transporter CrcB, partial [Neisseria sp.]
MFAYIFPIVCGAAVGAVLRWLFGLVLVSSAPF